MKRPLAAMLLVAVAFGAGYAGWWTRDRQAEPLTAPTDGAPAAVARLFALTLPDATGVRQALGQWRGKVLVVNYWATWCPPCREEMPLLARAQAAWAGRGVQVIGMGVDEAQAIAQFAARQPTGFPLLVADAEAIALAAELGNSSQGLPFTAVIDRHGRVAHLHLGALRGDQLDRLLTPLTE